MKMKIWLSALMVLLLVSFTACAGVQAGLEEIAKEAVQEVLNYEESSQAAPPSKTTQLDKAGVYTTKAEVALYLHQYGELPANFITKKQAQKLGWPGGELEPYAPGKSIGGSVFGNYDGILPEKKGRKYHECDIDTKGAKKRGAKRIVYSDDGLIYYTDDHYKTFALLYGEE